MKICLNASVIQTRGGSEIETLSECKPDSYKRRLENGNPVRMQASFRQEEVRKWKTCPNASQSDRIKSKR